MILLALFIILVIITVSIFIVSMFFGYTKWMRNIFIACLIGTCIFGSICGFGSLIATDNMKEIRADYEELATYYSTVENSTHEYVRFDYYQKVVDYNERYEQLVKRYNNPWISGLYPKDGLENIGIIDFQLIGDIYPEVIE